jgi:hypothetical protein
MLRTPNFKFRIPKRFKGTLSIGLRKAWIVAKPQTLQDAAAFLYYVMSLEENQESLGPGRLECTGQRDGYKRQRSDPRDDHRGSCNRHQRRTGRYESGRNNRNSYRNQEWQGRSHDSEENRNPNRDRDSNRRTQAAAVSNPSYGTGTKDRQDRQEENRN